MSDCAIKNFKKKPKTNVFWNFFKKEQPRCTKHEYRPTDWRLSPLRQTVRVPQIELFFRILAYYPFQESANVPSNLY